MDSQDYVANCFSRILRAECHKSQFQRRSEALADALRATADNGVDAGHAYLLAILKDAEEGAYAQSRRPAAVEGGEGKE